MRLFALTLTFLGALGTGIAYADKECPPSYKLVNGYCVPE